LAAILGSIALVACTATATAAALAGNWLQATLSDPTVTVQSFYGALQQRDYRAAYAYFSSSATARLSESAFVDQFSGYDTIDGPVSGVSLTAPRYSRNTTGASLIVTVMRRGGTNRQETHVVDLVKEHGVWRIDSIRVQFLTGVTFGASARRGHTHLLLHPLADHRHSGVAHWALRPYNEAPNDGMSPTHLLVAPWPCHTGRGIVRGSTQQSRDLRK
jgi:hypothetical protein